MATTAHSAPFPAAQATALRARGAPADPRTKQMAIPADQFSESVYRLIASDYNPPAKEHRYRSLFASQARKEYSSGTKAAASMGPAKVKLQSPSEHLKKGQGTLEPRERIIRKQALPTGVGKHTVPSSKDFVRQNALDNINSFAKQPKVQPAAFVLKKDYGSNPEYNSRRMAQAQKAHELEEQHRAMKNSQRQALALEERGIVVMPQDERLRILEGLKKNWEQLNLDYQRLSLTVDTVPKIARKVGMEAQLKEYEALIDKFSNADIHVNFNPVYH